MTLHATWIELNFDFHELNWNTLNGVQIPLNWIQILKLNWIQIHMEFKFNRTEMQCKLVNRVLKICLALLLFVHMVLKNNSFKNTLFHPIEVNSKSKFIWHDKTTSGPSIFLPYTRVDATIVTRNFQLKKLVRSKLFYRLEKSFCFISLCKFYIDLSCGLWKEC
jgi:hypothetical protein